MLETDENVNDETPEGDAQAEDAASAPDEAPDQVAEEVVAPEEPAEEPTADEVADAPAEEAAAEDAPAEEPAAEEAPAEEPASEEAPAEAAAEEPAAEEAAAEDAPAEELAAEEAPPEEVAEEPAAAEAPPAEAAEPEEQLSPKELRKRSRSTHEGEALPQRSVEERAQERAERRRTKAQHRRAYRLKQRERRAGQPRAQAETAPVDHAAQQGTLKVRQGVVVSDKADKTITVRIDIARQHRMYKKIVRTSSTLHAHDEQNEAHVGDMVRVIESRPLSRKKRWRLVEVLERAR
jgi:small subunit ribosomal protein S17